MEGNRKNIQRKSVSFIFPMLTEPEISLRVHRTHLLRCMCAEEGKIDFRAITARAIETFLRFVYNCKKSRFFLLKEDKL